MNRLPILFDMLTKQILILQHLRLINEPLLILRNLRSQSNNFTHVCNFDLNKKRSASYCKTYIKWHTDLKLSVVDFLELEKPQIVLHIRY